LLVSVPGGVVTVTYPVVAPRGTSALIKVSETTWKFAGVPFKKTLVVPMSPWPKIAPVDPTLPASRPRLTNGVRFNDRRKMTPSLFVPPPVVAP